MTSSQTNMCNLRNNSMCMTHLIDQPPTKILQDSSTSSPIAYDTLLQPNPDFYFSKTGYPDLVCVLFPISDNSIRIKSSSICSFSLIQFFINTKNNHLFLKDTWTTPRGMVEARQGRGFGWGRGEWWGENADNCN